MTEAPEHVSRGGLRNNGFNREIMSRGRVFVLFYASWCPFCRAFLPIFDEYAKTNPNDCLRIEIDEEPDLCDQYLVDYYPTVIQFKKGRIIRRLDSEPNVGLSRNQFKRFVENQ